MKISKMKSKFQTPLANPIIDMERPLEKVLKKGEYRATKCHATPGNNESRSYEINLSYYGGGTPEEWLVWQDKLLKVLDGQSISTRPYRYICTERHLTGDVKATLKQAALLVYILLITSTKCYPGYTFTEMISTGLRKLPLTCLPWILVYVLLISSIKY